MKKHTKYLLFSIITALFIYTISGGDCKDDTVVNQIDSSDCGASQTFHKSFQNSEYLITYMTPGNIRYFGYSAGVLSNVCAKSNPIYNGTVFYTQDTAHRFTFNGTTQWGNNGGTFDIGTITPGFPYTWTSTYTIDLQYEFPSGPASFNDIRIDVYFPTFGTLDADRNYLLNRMGDKGLDLAYKLFLLDFSDYIFDFSNQPRDYMRDIMPLYDNAVKTDFVWKN